MRLINVKSGNIVKVVGYEGGKGLQQKLRQLGLSPGDCARVIRQAPFGGPFLIDVRGRSIALGRGVAAKILVEEI